MEPIFCIVVGLFFAASIYLMLSPQLVRILLGVSIFGNAVNLLIFTAGRLTEAAPPILSSETTADGSSAAAGVTVTPTGPYREIAEEHFRVAGSVLETTANPLPQALILTAIVISFSIFAFLLVLALRAYEALDSDNVNNMRLAEPEPVRPPLGY